MIVRSPAALLVGLGLAFGQAPAIEVASVKINTSGDRRSSMQLDSPDRLMFTNQRLDTLIALAYRIPPGRLTGGPSWLQTERFDVAVKADRPFSQAERSDLLRSLLEERFKVKVRAETTEGDVYALVLARSDGRLGPDLRRSTCGDASPNGIPGEPRPTAPGRPGCGRATGALTLYVADGVLMSQLAQNLGGMMRQSVVDRTGLTDRFDVTLRATPVDYSAPGTPAEQPPSIFTAVQEQLGLRLQRERAPIQTFVVEHAERPTPD